MERLKPGQRQSRRFSTITAFYFWNKREIESQFAVTGRNGQVVFSSEYIHLLLRTGEELERLKLVLNTIGVHEIEVVIYLRRPVDLANSYFSTSVKAGVTDSKPQPPENSRYEHLCHHKNTIQRFENAFGQHNITVRLYDRSEFSNGSIVSDFLSILGIQDEKYFVIPDNLNESLSSHGLDIQRSLNRFFPRWIGDELNPLLPRLIKRVSREFSGVGPTMPEELQRRYEQHFEASDMWLKQNYFPQKTNLYSSSAPNLSETAKQESRNIELQAVELAREFLREVSSTPLDSLWEYSKQVPAPYTMSGFTFQDSRFENLVSLSIGVSQYHLGMVKNAIEQLELILTTDRNNTEALIYNAMCLSELGKYKAADVQYSKLICRYPNNFRVFRLYALNAEKQDLIEIAKARWCKVLDRFPDNLEAFFKMGICDLKLLNYKQALDQFDALLKTNPEHVPAKNYRSLCLAALS